MDIRLYRVLDSRASETVYASYGNISASSPSGKSVGTYEVPVAPKGVNQAISFAEKYIIPKIKIGIKQQDFDKGLEEICGEDYGKVGSAVSLALSILNMKVLAKDKDLYAYLNKNTKKEDLPFILANTIGGGLHTHNKMPIQEILGLSKTTDFEKRVDNLKN